MIIPYEMLRTLHEIPEELVENTSNMVGGSNNAFKQLLQKAAEFRKANTKPVFMVNEDNTVMVVTCEETMNEKKLH